MLLLGGYTLEKINLFTFMRTYSGYTVRVRILISYSCTDKMSKFHPELELGGYVLLCCRWMATKKKLVSALLCDYKVFSHNENLPDSFYTPLKV